MTKNTPATTPPERDWVAEVAEIWNQLAQGGNMPKSAELAQALAARFKITTSTADALIAGFQSLVSYACSEQAEVASALEEERFSVQAAFRAVRMVLEARLQHRLDEADLKLPEAKCLVCGRKALSQGRRGRNWQSTVGELQLVGRYLLCEQCEQGLAPPQQVVCLPASDYTAGLEEVTTLMATTVPHQMAADLVEKLLGLEVSPQAIKSSVERRAEA